MEQRNSFTFYRSFYEAIKELPEKNQLILYKSIIEYSLYYKKPVGLSGIDKTIWTLVEPSLTSSINKSKAGKTPRKEQNPNRTGTEVEQKPNRTETKREEDRDRDRGKDKDKRDILSGKKPDHLATSKLILDYLNKTANTAYRQSKSSLDPIRARLHDLDTNRHGLDQYPDVSLYQWCENIINIKMAKWGKDPKMMEFLRPSTLFRKSNFESYLGEVLTSIKKSEE